MQGLILNGVALLSVLCFFTASLSLCDGFLSPTPASVTVKTASTRCKNRMPSTSSSSSASTTTTTALSVLPIIDPFDVTHQATNSLFLTDFFQTISDAATATAVVIPTADVDATAAAAAVATDDGGWWAAYLNIFKSALLLVHNTIDGPLRSVGWTQTWGVSIFLFTAGVRSLLIPLSVQQSKSSEYLKVLRPYVSEIKVKFADNPDAQNRAIGKLYDDAKQNPLSGCFLSLAQLPIFLGLYRGVRLLARDGALDEPFLWIPSLEGPVTAESNYQGLDWLTQNWQTIDGTLTPSLGWETTLAFCVMPVLLVLGQSLTMSVLSPPIDENASDEEREQLEKTQGIMKFLPLMIGFFSLQVPAGLTIYWAASNAFTLTQSLAVRKYYELNPPKIELPEYWDSLDNMDAMTIEEKRQAAKAGLAVGPKLEDLIAESKFHTVVERTPLRPDSDAWKRIVMTMEDGGNNDNKDGQQASSSSSLSSFNIPTELQSWVQAASASVANGSQQGAFDSRGLPTNGSSVTTTKDAAEAAAVVTSAASA